MVESALIGDPPATIDDTWIVRGLLLAAGLLDVKDPADGIQLPPPRPPPDMYRHESREGIIIASACVSLVVMIAFSGTRLMLRAFKRGLQWGWDDWVMLPGAVCQILQSNV